MKRSEIINMLTDMISNYDKATKKPEYEMFANAILNTLENHGMSPAERYRCHDWHERGITYAQWIQEPSMVNEWEPEN